MRKTHLVYCCSLLFAVVMLAPPPTAPAQFAVAITIAPPALPLYEQPICPGRGYLWTPGYWAWGPGGYYWVPGTWVLAPVGLLWTPGYWAWDDDAFVWNAGYWAPQIGFYGGIFYGFGYVGVGYAGGYWRNGALFYNRSVNNVTETSNITNVYNKTVVNNVSVNNVSYNGGAGGTTARPTAAEQAAARAQHVPPTTAQIQQERAASSNHALLASVNHGKPAIAATPKPGVFSGQGGPTAKPPKTNQNETARPARPSEENKPENLNERVKPVQPPESKPPERRESVNPTNKAGSEAGRKPEQPREQGKERQNPRQREEQ